MGVRNSLGSSISSLAGSLAGPAVLVGGAYVLVKSGALQEILGELTRAAIDAVKQGVTGPFEAGEKEGRKAGEGVREWWEEQRAPSISVPTAPGGFSDEMKAPKLTNTPGITGGVTRVFLDDGRSLWIVDEAYRTGGYIPPHNNEFYYDARNGQQYFVITFEGLSAMDAYYFLQAQGY